MLCKNGINNIEAAVEKWEAIVRKNAEANGSFAYANYLQLYKSYEKLRCDSLLINAILTKLFFKIDFDDVADLARKGFKLDTTHGDEAFTASLEKAIVKSTSITTRLTMKQNELKQYYKENQAKSKRETSFASLMANLNLNLGMVESDEILLAKYNEYNKILKARQSDGRNQRG